jgi:nitrogen fixation/metabolism regulation signal transduction histidine kinase
MTQEFSHEVEKISATTQSDISFFTPDGKLFNSTAPEVYERRMIGSRISPEAYYNICQRNQRFFINRAEIAGFKLWTLYAPVFNDKGELIAIINTPYTDRSLDFRREATSHAATIVNLFLLLLIGSLMVTSKVVNSMFAPLVVMGHKMKSADINHLEYIDYQRDDELTSLVDAYNRMVKDLSDSTRQLAQSERDYAWSQMARQVAHEIKNPLTPMKLNIQFLQMAWDEKNPDIDRKLRETTKSILEQIDILSNIATAFSDYAKLPKKNIETFNLKEVIVNTINLYDNNDNIKIDIIEENESDYVINSDKNNLSIVFGNILKNAIQAIGKKENGLIEFRITDNGGRYRIEISDNGCGIGEEEKKKIFMPNFTTKSSGMGVGLSIVYDILETLGGNITFESEVGKGTTFFVEIKKDTESQSRRDAESEF